MYIYDMYSGNKLAVLSSVSWLGLVLPIQMTGGSKPVAEAWKTCVHVKRSYSWLAPRGPTGPGRSRVFGRWFIRFMRSDDTKTTVQDLKRSDLKTQVINHKVRICKD